MEEKNKQVIDKSGGEKDSRSHSRSRSHSTSYTSYTSYTRGRRKNYYSNPVPPYFKLIGIVLGVLCSVGLLVSIFSITGFGAKRNALLQEGYTLKQNNDALETQIEASNIAAFEDVLFKVYTDKTELYNTVKTCFNYSMKINGTLVTNENYYKFDLTSSELTIELIETVKDNSLPFSVAKKASIFSPERISTKEPVTVSGTTTPFETETTESGNSTIQVWRFTDLQVGEIVSVFFNEYSLVEDLKLETNSFEITHTRNK